MDRIDLFRIFVRVVECSSFTRAADSLDLPRSSVSAAIAGLETRVGARLLHRTTRKVSPTQDGTVFYQRCLQVLADVEATENLFRESDDEPVGKVRIDVPARIGRLIVAPALPVLLDRYPQLDIELGATDRAVDLVEQRVDCALRVGPLDDSSLIARPVGQLALINVASPAYLGLWGTPATPDDLTHHLAVNYASPSNGRIEEWEWLEDGAIRRCAMNGRVTTNNAESYIACCVAGLGLIQIPAYDVRGLIAKGKLVEVLPDHRAAALPITLLYSHRRNLSRRVRLVAEWLEDIVRRNLLV